ncbi:hypothetical protein DFJ73DRAFT_964620 [Zopfochytrium polystomum]|nr:hypothetical protein DFJ73DRAFT_964620 [Zopfochytrium polystomum]
MPRQDTANANASNNAATANAASSIRYATPPPPSYPHHDHHDHYNHNHHHYYDHGLAAGGRDHLAASARGAQAAPLAKARAKRLTFLEYVTCLAFTSIFVVGCIILILVSQHYILGGGSWYTAPTAVVTPTVLAVQTTMATTVTSTLSDGRTTQYATTTTFSTSHTVAKSAITSYSSSSTAATPQPQTQTTVTYPPYPIMNPTILSHASDSSAISAPLPFHPVANTSISYQDYLTDATGMNSQLSLLDSMGQYSYRYALGRTVVELDMLDYCTTFNANNASYFYQYLSLNFFDDANTTVGLTVLRAEVYTGYTVVFTVSTEFGLSVLLPPLYEFCSRFDPAVTGLWLDVDVACNATTIDGGDVITVALFSQKEAIAAAFVSVVGRSPDCIIASGNPALPQELALGMDKVQAKGKSVRPPNGVLVVKQFGYAAPPVWRYKSGSFRVQAPFVSELVIVIVTVFAGAVAWAG